MFFANLLLAPLVAGVAATYVLGSVAALAAGCLLTVRVCQWLHGQITPDTRDTLTGETIAVISGSVDLDEPRAEKVEIAVYLTASVGWLLFGTQLALVVLYGLAFTLIVAVLQAANARRARTVDSRV